MPYSYEVINCSLDFVMDFSILCDGTNGVGKRLCSTKDITPRLMYDVSPNRGFGVVYELGDFWNKNDDLKAMCSEYLNDSWWSNEAADEDSESELEVNFEFVTSSYLNSSPVVIVMLVIGMALLAVIRFYGSRTKSSKDTEHISYGTV